MLPCGGKFNVLFFASKVFCWLDKGFFPWNMFSPFWLFIVLWEQWPHSLQLIIRHTFYNLKRHLLIDMGVKINYNVTVSHCMPRLILRNKINRMENTWSLCSFKSLWMIICALVERHLSSFCVLVHSWKIKQSTQYCWKYPFLHKTKMGRI